MALYPGDDVFPNVALYPDTGELTIAIPPPSEGAWPSLLAFPDEPWPDYNDNYKTNDDHAWDDLWFEVYEDPMRFVYELRKRGMVGPPPGWRPVTIPNIPTQPFM